MSAPRWTQDVPTDTPDQLTRGEAGRLVRGLPLDARLIAWILGFTLAALLCLAFGDALAGWAGLR